MKKFLSLLSAITIVGTAPAAVVSCGSNTTTTYDLNNMSSISDGNVGIYATNPKEASLDEVGNVIVNTINNAINNTSGKTVNVGINYTYTLYSDNQGTELQGTVDLTATVDPVIYVKIIAYQDNIKLTGETGYIAVTLQQAAAYNLNNLKNLTSDPTIVIAKNLASTTKAEIKNSLEGDDSTTSNLIIFNAIKKIIQPITKKAYTYDVFKDNKGTALDTIDLTSGMATVYVKVTAVMDPDNNKFLTGETGYIAVEIRSGDISKVTMSDPMTVADPTKNYKDLNDNLSLINSVIAAIKAKLSIEVTKNDFTLKNTKEQSSDKQAAGEVDVTVTATSNSLLIQNNFTFKNTLQAPAKYDLSKIIAISSGPVSVVSPADNTKVTADEVKKAIDGLGVVQQYASTAVETTDYTYGLFMDKQGQTAYAPQNLTTGSKIIYVKITAVQNSQLVTNATGYIAVTIINQYDLMQITSISDEAVSVTAQDVTKVTAAEVQTAIEKLQVVQQYAENAVETKDYTYGLFMDAEGQTPYISQNLSTGSVTIYVQITAK